MRGKYPLYDSPIDLVGQILLAAILLLAVWSSIWLVEIAAVAYGVRL